MVAGSNAEALHTPGVLRGTGLVDGPSSRRVAVSREAQGSEPCIADLASGLRAGDAPVHAMLGAVGLV